MVGLAQLVYPCQFVRLNSNGMVQRNFDLVRDSDYLALGKGYPMIWLYTGTPGSGKSLHAARDIVQRMRRGGGLICNFPINENQVKKRKIDPLYLDNSEMTPAYFYAYAQAHHKIGKENQCLCIIDEAQIIFNCRDFGVKGRNDWVKLFSQHRKLGYNFILITQNDRMLDKQIRALVEYEIKHRKINNKGLGGMLVSCTGMTWFAAIEYWYGMKGPDAKLGVTFFPYQKKFSKIYDSYRLFDSAPAPVAGGGAGGHREAVGPRGNPPAAVPGEVWSIPCPQASEQPV